VRGTEGVFEVDIKDDQLPGVDLANLSSICQTLLQLVVDISLDGAHLGR